MKKKQYTKKIFNNKNICVTENIIIYKKEKKNKNVKIIYETSYDETKKIIDKLIK